NALVNHTISQIEDLVIPTKTLLHSDRGYQYTSKDFKKYIEKHQLVQSMSRLGKCIDNGPMENFWGIIKEEMYRLTIYDTFEARSEEHTSELQSRFDLVCRLLLEKKKKHTGKHLHGERQGRATRR